MNTAHLKKACPCKKCGRPVAPSNDAVLFDLVRRGIALDSIEALLCRFEFGAQHLLPDGDCPGSPSRAQYIEGQPKDDRYPYRPEYEASFRATYQSVIAQLGAE